MRTFAALTLVGLLTIAPAALAQDDPCAGETLTADEVGLTYQGHCITFNLDGPPVQDIIISETTDAWGKETALGILIVLGPDGTPVIEPVPYLVTNTDEVELGEPYLLPEGGG